MISGEDASFIVADFYNGTLSRFTVDQTSDVVDNQVQDVGMTLAAGGFPDIQTNMIYNFADNTQTDDNQNFSSIDPLIDLYEAQNYVSLFESSGLPFYRPQESTGDGPLDIHPFQDFQQSLQAVNVNNVHGLQSSLNEDVGASYLPSTSIKGATPTAMKAKSLKRVPKKSKRSEAESEPLDIGAMEHTCNNNKECRRFIVSQKIQVLHDDLPETSKDKRPNQISILHDLIGHIEHLQLQLKELSKSRLASTSNSVPLMFVEGYGYYHPDADKSYEPLEEFIRRLFEDPDTARKVLENYGLFTVPMASFYDLQ